MKLVFPDPLSFQRLHPVNRRNLATRSLSGTPGGAGPIQPRQAAPGNVSMYDHLQSIKAAAEEALEPAIKWEAD